MPGDAYRAGMSGIPATELARADTNGRQKPSGAVIVELDGKASVVVVPQRSADQPLEWR